ncbi:FixH family protein [Rubellimicrobium rubrum]|nr:FixH family protein [Rubellimicrobium rubrum]
MTYTEPTDSTVLPDLPDEVVIHFNEPVALTRAQVLGPEGEDVLPPERAEAREDELHLDLPEELDQGTYTVSYHVVSLDGHPIAGSLVFSVGAASQSSGAVEDGTAGWRWAFVAARVALYLALLGAVGAVAYGHLVRSGTRTQHEMRRVTATAAILGVGAAVVALGLQGCLLMGGPPGILIRPATWVTGLSSTFGCAALCAMAGLGLVWVGSQLASRTGDGLVMLGALVALASFGLSGHVVTAGPRGWTTPLLLIHAALAAFWVGSLLPLLRALDAPAGEAASAVQRFSALAVVAVPVLILVGLALTWIQVRQPEGLVTTPYGLVLLIKVGLVGALLGLATLNRLILTPGLTRGEAGAARRLGRSIQAEVGVAVLILAATAALGATSPPRALMAQAEASDAHAHKEHRHTHEEQRLSLAAQNFRAELTLVSGQAGPKGASLSITDHAGQPLDVPEITLRLSNPEKGIAPLERLAERLEPGQWRIAELPLSLTGTWSIELDVLISDFERQTALTELTIR